MTKLIFILLIIAAVIPACSNSKTANQSVRKSDKVDRYRAWNEDTTLTCQFAIRSDDTFAYLFSSLDTNGKTIHKIYHGTVKFLDDKVFLLYQRNIRPPNVQSFLIKEISGGYFFQDFTDGRKRMALRITYPRSFR